MRYRDLGRTGWRVSEVSFGAWAIGGAWGAVDDRESLAALNRAIDMGRPLAGPCWGGAPRAPAAREVATSPWA